MTERIRMAVAKLYPKKRLPRVYGKVNRDDVSANTFVHFDDHQIQSEDSNWAVARCTIGLTAGAFYWETEHQYSGSGDASSGIMVATAPLTSRIGGAIGGTSGPDKSGDFYRNTFLILNLADVASGTRIRHWLDVDAGIYKVAIGGGAWNTTAADPAESYKVWFPALAAKTLDGNSVLYSHPDDFLYSVPPGANAGYYEDPLEDVEVNVSSHAFTTSVLDEPPNVRFEARIDMDSDIEIIREATCWVWDNSRGQSSRGQMTLIVDDRDRAEWSRYVWRDARVEIYAGYVGDIFAALSLWTTGRVESDSFSRRRLTLKLTDEWSVIKSKPIVTTVYPETIENPQLMHRPMPLCMGRPMFCEPLLLSNFEFGDTAFTYDFSDRALYNEYMDVSDKSDVFAYPDDWEYLINFHGIRLFNKPDGKVVGNPYGGFVIRENVIDENNNGNFVSWVPGAIDDDPENWTVIDENSSGRVVGPGGASGTVNLHSSGGRRARMQWARVLESGQYWLVKLRVVSINEGQLFVGCVDIPTNVITAPGDYEYIFDGQDRNFEVWGDETAVSQDVVLDYVYLYKIDPTEYLPAWMDSLLLDRGKIDPLKVDTAGIAAFHDLYPNVRLAFYETDSVSFERLATATMDSYCGGVYTKLNGKLSVGNVHKPSNPIATLEEYRIKGELTRTIDGANKLTTILAGKRNHAPFTDSDFSDLAQMHVRAAHKSEYLLYRIARPGEVSTARQDVVSVQVSQADAAGAKGTLIQDEGPLQAEANRVGVLWKPLRYFYDGEWIMDRAVSDVAEPYDTLHVVHSDHQLQNGADLLIKKIAIKFFSPVAKITFWGSPENE